MGLIKRSKEILINQGIQQYIVAIKRYFWWHPILYEVRWHIVRYLRSKYQIIEVIHGHKMQVDISLDGIHKCLYLFGYHERESAEVFSEIIPKNATVVDIGANIGYYTLIEARVANKVYAIEPEPNNIKLLKKNVELNSYEDIIEVHQFAVSDVTGKATLTISDIPNQHRLQTPSDTQSGKSIEVKTITLDEFLKEKDIDVVRIDVEGAEWLVINGMKELLSKEKPMRLFIEVHQNLIVDYMGDANALLDFLFKVGFSVSHLGVIAFEPAEFSFKNYIKADNTRIRIFDFNPPANKQKFYTHTSQILRKYTNYHVFLLKS
jgi:FkbM family methyltransferase